MNSGRDFFEFTAGKTEFHSGANLSPSTGAAVVEFLGTRRALVVTDENVAARYAEPVRASLEAAGMTTGLLAVTPGEASKSLGGLAGVYDTLADLGVGRDGVVVGVGGGVVTDLAGFAAATWMRGIPSVLIPTTLEAQIDAAIGGKTAVNHPRGKNLIGAFHHPRLVVCDVATLATLSDRDLAAGLAESVKHAAIRDETFLSWHEEHAADATIREEGILVELVRRNVRIKADIVLCDERETTGERAMLNYGHTIGHAIEACGRFDLRHGECVAIGMAAAGWLAVQMGMLDAPSADRIEAVLAGVALPVRLPSPVGAEVLQPFIALDKKAVAGVARFVLLKSIGQPVLCDSVPDDLVRKAVGYIQPAC